MSTENPGQQPAGAAAAVTPAAVAPVGAEHPAGTAPAGTTPPAGTPPVDVTQQANDAWWKGVTEPEIVEFAKAKNYPTPDDALRALWSANKMNKMEPAVQAFLDGKATPEQEAAVFNKLGRPESAEKYELKAAPGIQIDPNLTALGKSLFHKLGATPARAQEAFDLWNTKVTEMNAARFEQENQENLKALTDLEASWGTDLERNKAAGARAITALGLTEADVDSIQKNIGAAGVVKLLAAIGRKSDEGGFKDGNGAGGGDPNNTDNMTPQQATARIEQLKMDTAFQTVLADKTHPGQQAALATWEKLFAKAG